MVFVQAVVTSYEFDVIFALQVFAQHFKFRFANLFCEYGFSVLLSDDKLKKAARHYIEEKALLKVGGITGLTTKLGPTDVSKHSRICCIDS